MTTDVAELKRTLRELITRKTAIEEELGALNTTATAAGGLLLIAKDFRVPMSMCTMYGSRAIPQPKLQNDHKQIMKDIETRMFALHKATPQQPKQTTTQTQTQSKPQITKTEALSAASSASLTSPPLSSSSSSSSSTSTSSSVSYRQSDAFYLVDSVSLDSPASLCGLRVGDRVVAFGSVNAANKSAAAMQRTVASSVGKSLPVTVHRGDSQFVTVHLVPQEWDGKGLLGCHLTDI